MWFRLSWGQFGWVQVSVVLSTLAEGSVSIWASIAKLNLRWSMDNWSEFESHSWCDDFLTSWEVSCFRNSRARFPGAENSKSGIHYNKQLSLAKKNQKKKPREFAIEYLAPACKSASLTNDLNSSSRLILAVVSHRFCHFNHCSLNGT